MDWYLIMLSNMWDLKYRRIWLPYHISPSKSNDKVCCILNRNYQPISNITNVDITTDSTSNKSNLELFGSVVKFKFNPKSFKDVWFENNIYYLYDDSVGSDVKSIQNYFKRLTNLFSYQHDLISKEEIGMFYVK
jgi:hypothetical protein